MKAPCHSQLNEEEMRSPVGRPAFKAGKGRQSVLGGFDSHSFPPISGSPQAAAWAQLVSCTC